MGISSLPNSSLSSPQDSTLSQVNVSLNLSSGKQNQSSQLKLSDISSKSTITVSGDDSFYSPDSSFETPEKKTEPKEKVTTEEKKEKDVDMQMEVDEVENVVQEKSAEDVPVFTGVVTPRSRRSYQSKYLIEVPKVTASN